MLERPLHRLAMSQKDRLTRPPDPRSDAKIGNSDIKVDGRRQRGSVRREAFLEAARALFIERGYRGTTLADIMSRAGGSRETMYRLFGDKRGLFSAIVGSVGVRFAASIVTPNALAMPPRDGLIRFGMDLANIWQSEEGKAVHRVVMAEGPDAPDLVDAWFNGGSAPSIEALVNYFNAQVAAKRLAPMNAPLVARQYIMLLMGELSFPMIARGTPPLSLEQQITNCVDLIMLAYRTGTDL